MFQVGDRVKPDANAIIKDNESCGYPTEGIFEELDNARGTVTHLHPNPKYVTVKWDDGMQNAQETSYLIKV